MNESYTVVLAPRYWVEKTIFAIICLVLGVWGIYDYAVAIPNQERAWEWRSLLTTYQKVFDSWQEPEFNDALKKASETLKEKIKTEIHPNSANKEDEKNSPVKLEIKTSLENSESVLGYLWLGLGIVQKESKTAVLLEEKKQLPDSLIPIKNFVLDGLNQVGEIEKPSDFDRYIQWAFILCLPYAFWLFLNIFIKKNESKKYKIDLKSKMLTVPLGTFSYSQNNNNTKDTKSITAIDMSSWSSKTGSARKSWMAWVITKDERKICLDDFPFKGMHKIVGEIAHHLEPELWTKEAKKTNSNKERKLNNSKLEEKSIQSQESQTDGSS